jgi:hypothetical protein
MAILAGVMVALLTLPSTTRAQIRIGVQGGLAKYDFNGDTPDKGQYNSKTRAAMGAVFEFDVFKGVRLSAQPSFIQKGTGISYEVDWQRERVDSVQVRMDYFSFPVTVKILTFSERWFVTGGLEFAWLLSAEYETSTEKDDVKDSLEQFDFAVQFGLGWIKPIGSHELFVEARYTQGILNVLQDRANEMGLQGLRVKNSGWLLLAGFTFQL